MKKVLNPLMAVAIFATATFAANVENPVYGPAQLGFYSKTGVAWMYKKSDDNLAMKAKNWVKETENPIPRITEDFGFGITDWLALRGLFGYTYDGDIERSGMHQARLGLNFRPINDATETVVWDIYVDAFLGGVSKMKAELVKSSNAYPAAAAEQPISFNYENYGNGRWGVWVGTQVGKTFDQFTVAVFGEVERTFGNDNNEIKINADATPVIGQLVQLGVLKKAFPAVCKGLNIAPEACNEKNSAVLTAASQALAAQGINPAQVANAYVPYIPKTFNLETKSTWEYAAGLKTLYEINNDWSMGGAFNWKHRATNGVKALKITNGSPYLTNDQKEEIKKGIAESFADMKDGVDEFALSLLGSRQLTEALALTLWGEYTFDTAEKKAQLGTTMKAELGLRMNWQF